MKRLHRTQPDIPSATPLGEPGMSGEVAMGIVIACFMAEDLGLISTKETARIKALLQGLQLPIQVPQYDPEAVYNGMLGDKKASNKGLRFILPTGIGRFTMADNPDKDLVLKAIKRAM